VMEALFLNRCTRVIRVELQIISAYMSFTSWSTNQVHLVPGSETDFRSFLPIQQREVEWFMRWKHNFNSSTTVIVIRFREVPHLLSGAAGRGEP
jgi:hypothetical protein